MYGTTLLRNGLRVLVVDSEHDSSELLAVMLAHYGIETITATCVSEAIEKMQQFQFDLLISEIILPNEDGYSLIQQVKHQIPAIALTVCAREQDRIRALTAGFSSHLPKPVNVEDLIATVTYLTR